VEMHVVLLVGLVALADARDFGSRNRHDGSHAQRALHSVEEVCGLAEPEPGPQKTYLGWLEAVGEAYFYGDDTLLIQQCRSAAETCIATKTDTECVQAAAALKDASLKKFAEGFDAGFNAAHREEDGGDDSESLLFMQKLHGEMADYPSKVSNAMGAVSDCASFTMAVSSICNNFGTPMLRVLPFYIMGGLVMALGICSISLCCCCSFNVCALFALGCRCCCCCCNRLHPNPMPNPYPSSSVAASDVRLENAVVRGKVVGRLAERFERSPTKSPGLVMQ